VLDNINLKQLSETRHIVILPVRFEDVVADSHAYLMAWYELSVHRSTSPGSNLSDFNTVLIPR